MDGGGEAVSLASLAAVAAANASEKRVFLTINSKKQIGRLASRVEMRRRALFVRICAGKN